MNFTYKNVRAEILSSLENVENATIYYPDYDVEPVSIVGQLQGLKLSIQSSSYHKVIQQVLGREYLPWEVVLDIKAGRRIEVSKSASFRAFTQVPNSVTNAGGSTRSSNSRSASGRAKVADTITTATLTPPSTCVTQWSSLSSGRDLHDKAKLSFGLSTNFIEKRTKFLYNKPIKIPVAHGELTPLECDTKR